MKVYVRDNFWNAGRTEIVDESERLQGEMDLKSAFGSSLDVYGPGGALVCSGSFRLFSNKWTVVDTAGQELGVLRHRLSFLTKKYEYDAGSRGCYEITSPAFSREYEVRDEAGQLAASFEKVSGIFSAGAYCLDNRTDRLDTYELVAVVMGMHEIQKRHNHAAT